MWLLKFKNFRYLMNVFQKIIQIAGYSRPYYRNDKVITRGYSIYKRDGQTSSLDIGSGPVPKNPFDANACFGADLRANDANNVVYSDLSQGALPFEDEKFDYVTAFDVLEHIPRVSLRNGETVFPFIILMNEIFRVLKPGGVFLNCQPVFPGKSAFQDPTHVNLMSEDTMDYYFCSKAWARIYGYSGSFELLQDGWVGEKYFAFMEKSAETPIFDIDHVQK